MQEIVQQIKGRKTAVSKFNFLQKDGIIFPKNLNLEQASSQQTAAYKATLFAGDKMADLTAGFGVDAYFISEKFQDVTLVERDAELLGIVRHNWEILGRKAHFINTTLEEFLKNALADYDLLYLDPARRDAQKNKVFLLEDLSPNLLSIKDTLLSKAVVVAVKLSPLIDLSYLLKVMPEIFQVEIIAVKNEVKEVLILLKKNHPGHHAVITCSNLESPDPAFSFNFKELLAAKPQFSEPEDYLYLPNNAVLKSGAFNLLAQRFGLKKLHPNTHLYTSAAAVAGFPGRVLRVQPTNPKLLPKGSKFNIISKNYPLTPEQIKKKYKLSDGGEHYLIFTESKEGKIVLRSDGI